MPTAKELLAMPGVCVWPTADDWFLGIPGGPCVKLEGEEGALVWDAVADLRESMLVFPIPNPAEVASKLP